MRRREVRTRITGNLWKIVVEVGRSVERGETLAIVESMKMEIPVEAPAGGVVAEIRAREGARLDEGDVILILEEEG
jgi:acetyl-CoA carboxylase biotin carboxyl carrier protein